MKKLSMRKAREKMEAENPDKYEEQKQKDRERKKATQKKIHELSERDKRSVRKGWKKKTKRSREMKKKRQQLIENLSTLPESPTVNILIDNELGINVLPGSSQGSSSRKSSGDKKCINKKKNFARVLSGKIIKKYRLQRSLYNLTFRYILLRDLIQPSNILKKQKLNIEVENFFEKNTSSRLTAGKKETMTRNKLKKQKRLLNDTILNLYNEFKQTTKSMFYSTFCKLRPFWVVQPHFHK